MQYSAILLHLAASVSAASIPRLTEPYFNVTALYIDSIAAAQSASYSLNATVDGISTRCAVTVDTSAFSQYCSGTAPFAPAIDSFGPRACDDAAFSWSLTRNAALSGYSLAVNYTAAATGQTVTGCRAIPESDFACYTQGDEHAMDQEDYIGAHNFTTPASTTSVCIYG